MKLKLFGGTFGLALVSDVVILVRGLGQIAAGHGSDPSPSWVVAWLFITIAVLVLSGIGFGFYFVRWLRDG